MNSKKLLSILGAAGVAVHVAGVDVSLARASASPGALERMLQRDPTRSDAAAIFDILADKGGKPGGGFGHGTGDGDHNGHGKGGGHDGNHGHGDGHGHDGDHGHYEG
jgi:hypothetical protein